MSASKPGRAFQDLVKRIEHSLAPSCEITSPDFLVDRTTGQKREVDVSIKTRVGAHVLLIIEECRDRRRPVDITYVEQIAKKRENVNADRAIIVSSTGFTKRAKAMAGHESVTLMTLKDAQTQNWGRWILRDLDVYQEQYVLEEVQFVPARPVLIAPTRPLHGLNSKGNVSAAENVFFDANGAPKGSVADVIHRASRSEGKIYAGLTPGAAPERRRFTLSLSDSDADRYFIRFGDSHYVEVGSIAVEGEFWIQHRRLPFKQMTYADERRGKVADYAEVTFDTKRKAEDRAMRFYMVGAKGETRVHVEDVTPSREDT